MTKKLKLLSKISLILVLLVMIGCVRDDFSEHHSSASGEKPKYKVSRVKWSDMQNKPSVMQKLNEVTALTKRGNYSGRGVYNETYGLVIDTTNIVMIQRDDYHSYTFEIIREDNDDILKLENLVLSLEKDGSYSTYITTYHLKEEELEMLCNGKDIEVEDRGTLEHYRMGERVISYSYQDEDGNCFEVIFIREENTDDFNKFVKLTYPVDCAEYGFPTGGNSGGSGGMGGSGGTVGGNTGHVGGPIGGSDGSGSGSGGSGSGSGNGQAIFDNGNGSLIITKPVKGLQITYPEYDENEHLEELNKITTQNTQGTNIFRNKIDEYIGMLNTAQEEIGVMYNRNYVGSYHPIAPLEIGFDYIIFPPATTTTQVILHLHHNFVNPNGGGFSSCPEWRGCYRLCQILS